MAVTKRSQISALLEKSKVDPLMSTHNIRKSQYIGTQAYQLILFNFSTGETLDTRTVQNKLLMPCLDETNVLNIFSIYENDPVIWNMEYLKKAIAIIQKHGDENTKKHLSYVKDLRRNK